MLAGVGVIGLALLAPTALEVRQLHARRAAAKGAHAQLTAEKANYVRFVRSVRRGDRLLLQRLALQELHLKPAGARTIELISTRRPPVEQRASYVPWLDAGQATATEPQPAPDAPWPIAADSTLVRLTTGPSRPLVLVAGCVLVGMGLITSLRQSEAEPTA